MDEPCTALALNGTRLLGHSDRKSRPMICAMNHQRIAQETRQVLELAAFADKPACAARLQDGSACVFEVEDGALEAAGGGRRRINSDVARRRGRA